MTVRISMLILTAGLTLTARAEWAVLEMGSAANNMIDVFVGDGRNDGINRVYGTSNDDIIHEFTWDDGSWTKVEAGRGVGSGVTSVVIGPGRNDGVNRLYASDYSRPGQVWEFTWDDGFWRTDVGNCPREVNKLALGDGRDDGVTRLYASCLDNFMYEFTWTGSSWTQLAMGSASGNMRRIVIGDGRNDRRNRVYVGNTNNTVYEFTWTGSSWQMATVGTGGSGYISGLALGDGRNDGVNRVYAGDWSYRTYEFEWTGSAWARDTVGGRGRGDVNSLTVGPGRNDRRNRVYAVTRTWGHVYEYTREGDAWTHDTIWKGPDGIGITLGDGRNDGRLRLYEAGFNSRMYELSYQLTAVGEPRVPGVERPAANRPTVARARLFLPGSAPAGLYDIHGRRVAGLAPGENDIRGLAPGVYFVREQEQVHRLVLAR